MNTNWFFLLFSSGFIIMLLITGSDSMLAYTFLSLSILLSAFMLYVGDEWVSDRTPGQLRFILSLVLAIVAGLSVWLLLIDIALWFKVLYTGIVTFTLAHAALSALPPTEVYILTDDVKKMLHSDQTPQEFVESDED